MPPVLTSEDKKILDIIFLLSLMGFFLCGFLLGGWAWSWSLLLINPALSVIFSLTNKPIKKIIKSICFLLVIGAMLFIGFAYSGWYWCWVLIFIIPIVNIIME